MSVNDVDDDPMNELQPGSLNGTKVVLNDPRDSSSFSEVELLSLVDDADPSNEIQTLAFSGTLLTIEHNVFDNMFEHSTVDLLSLIDDADFDTIHYPTKK